MVRTPPFHGSSPGSSPGRVASKNGVACNKADTDGVVAQLVEHHNGIVGVRSSILLGSTIRR